MSRTLPLDRPAARPVGAALEQASRRSPSLPASVAPAALALAACLVCWAAGWRGTDWAAQIYRAGQVSRNGLALWDPGWYGGTYPLNYSLVFPLAAGYLGLWPVAALSAAGAATCFDRLVTAGLGRRPLASYYFALTTFIEVAIGQLPMLAGEALGLGCVLCMRSRRAAFLSVGFLLAALAGLSSPVAGSFTALAMVAWGLSARRLGLLVLRLGAGAVALVASATLPVMFPEPGWFPFSFPEAASVVVIALLFASPLLGVPDSVRWGAALYALITVMLFAVHTPMGDNDARLAAYIGVPLALAYLPSFTGRPRKGLRARWPWLAAAGAAVCLVVWDWSPAVEAFSGAADGASSVASYYRPLEAELGRLAGGQAVRVEVPPLAHHWESAYLAPHFPLARGWERQLDIAYAPIFYQARPLSARAYHRWLVANGVSYVALADAPLDYAASAEAALLRSGGVPGLVPVWRSKHWRVWKVAAPTGLASAPARVVALGPAGLALRFSNPGTSVVKVRWSAHWSLSRGETGTACLQAAPGGWTEVTARAVRYVRLKVSLLGANHGDCSAIAGARAP